MAFEIEPRSKIEVVPSAIIKQANIQSQQI
jgi:hypothetical protein